MSMFLDVCLFWTFYKFTHSHTHEYTHTKNTIVLTQNHLIQFLFPVSMECRWVPGEWSTCSKSCGGGKQTRKVLCRKRQSKTADQIVSKHICRHLPKPHRQYQCNMHECPPDWHAGRWSKVDKLDTWLQAFFFISGTFTSSFHILFLFKMFLYRSSVYK